MMKNIFRTPRKTILYGAMLAADLATDPAQAQDADNDYPNPQPCGPGAAATFMKEPHEVPEDHFALFDAYWYTTVTTTAATVSDTASVGVLHTNEVPTPGDADDQDAAR